MHWSFATINKKLAEVYFERKRGKTIYLGHCYVTKEECDTKEEQKWIKEDMTNIKLTYRDGKYTRISD